MKLSTPLQNHEQRIWIDYNSWHMFSVYVGMGNRRSVKVVSYNDNPIWEYLIQR